MLIKKESQNLTNKGLAAPSSLLDRIKNNRRALLLDASPSMATEVPEADYKSKFELLKEAVRNFPSMRKFQFATRCIEVNTESLALDNSGGTAMHTAFEAMAQAEVRDIILITDGEPDNESLALEAAKKLNKIDIIYIGPKPIPQFLSALAAVTGGKFVDSSVGEEMKMLGTKIKGLLGA